MDFFSWIRKAPRLTGCTPAGIMDPMKRMVTGGTPMTNRKPPIRHSFVIIFPSCRAITWGTVSFSDYDHVNLRQNWWDSEPRFWPTVARQVSWYGMGVWPKSTCLVNKGGNSTYTHGQISPPKSTACGPHKTGIPTDGSRLKMLDDPTVSTCIWFVVYLQM